MTQVPHEYVPNDVGHSAVTCKWCAGTPNENAVLGPNHCDERAKKDPAVNGSKKTMTDEMKSNAATGFVVVGMHNGNGPEAFKVMDILDNEPDAQKRAKELAEMNEGAIFGVYQKVGSARLVRQVEWRGQRG